MIDHQSAGSWAEYRALPSKLKGELFPKVLGKALPEISRVPTATRAAPGWSAGSLPEPRPGAYLHTPRLSLGGTRWTGGLALRARCLG